MAHIAFFSPAAAGHINRALGMLSELIARGHRVSFTTTETYAGRVVDAGVEIVRFTTAIAPLPDKPSNLNRTDLSRSLMDDVAETKTQCAALPGWYRGSRPDLIAVPQMVEQRATADRMETVGIGPAEASVATLRETIREVVADRSIEENLVSSRRKLKDAGGTSRAVGVLEKVLAEEAGRS